MRKRRQKPKPPMSNNRLNPRGEGCSCFHSSLTSLIPIHSLPFPLDDVWMKCADERWTAVGKVRAICSASIIVETSSSPLLQTEIQTQVPNQPPNSVVVHVVSISCLLALSVSGGSSCLWFLSFHRSRPLLLLLHSPCLFLRYIVMCVAFAFCLLSTFIPSIAQSVDSFLLVSSVLLFVIHSIMSSLPCAGGVESSSVCSEGLSAFEANEGSGLGAHQQMGGSE